MTAYSVIMAFTCLIAGAFVLWIGIKARKGALKRNNWIGLKTQRLLESDLAWRKGHAAAAPMLIASSLPLLIGGIAFLFVNEDLIAWISIPVVALLVGLTLLASKKAHTAL